MYENVDPKLLTEADKRLLHTNEYRSVAVLAQWLIGDDPDKSEAATHCLLAYYSEIVM